MVNYKFFAGAAAASLLGFHKFQWTGKSIDSDSPSTDERTNGNFANELREQIKSRNEKKKILDELQLFDSKIEDIIVDGLNIEVYLRGVDKPIPIQAMGAGSFTVLEMASIFGREKIKNILIQKVTMMLKIIFLII